MSIIGEDTRTYSIIGAGMAVHGLLGHGFLEAVYQEALAIEFAKRGIPFIKESEIEIHYSGILLSTRYRADFLCFSGILIELKAHNKLSKSDSWQVINYLKATGLNLGILFNFGAPSLEYKRILST